MDAPPPMGVAYYISGILKLTYFRSDSNLPIYRLLLYNIFDAEFGLSIGGVDCDREISRLGSSLLISLKSFPMCHTRRNELL
jgi:hypothetical protein